MNKRKLKLEEIKVESFVTKLSQDSGKTIEGGVTDGKVCIFTTTSAASPASLIVLSAMEIGASIANDCLVPDPEPSAQLIMPTCNGGFGCPSNPCGQ